MGLCGSILVGVGLVIVQMIRAKRQDLSDVAGVWVMTTVPLLTTAATAGTILPYVARESTRAAPAVLVTGYMSWFLAMSELMFILTIFFFRFIAYKMPAQSLMASSFLPVAALSQGAYAIHRLSVFFAGYVQSSGYGPTQVHPPPIPTTTIQATSEVFHWVGILMSLGLLAHATFCKAFILAHVPRHYSLIVLSRDRPSHLRHAIHAPDKVLFNLPLVHRLPPPLLRKYLVLPFSRSPQRWHARLGRNFYCYRCHRLAVLRRHDDVSRLLEGESVQRAGIGGLDR